MAKPGKATNEEISRRIAEVTQLLIQGKTRLEIADYCLSEYKIKRAQAYLYIKKAWVNIEKYSEKNLKQNFYMALRRYNDLYDKNYVVQDYRECRNVQGDINSLLRLDRIFDEEGDTQPLTHSQQLARSNTLAMAKLIHKNYIDRQVHRVLAAEMDRFAAEFRAGLAPRVVFEVSPRVGKTTLVESLVTRLEGEAPLNVLWVSYNATLAKRSSRMIQSVIERDSYKAIFGDLKAGSKRWGVEEWKTGTGGGLIARGFKTGAEGENIDLIIMDDLCRDYIDYLSKAMNEQYDHFFESLTSRIENETAILIIGRRWGEDDPIDKARKKLPGNWRTLKIPALCVDPETDPLGRQMGEAAFPDKTDEKTLLEIRKTLGALEFDWFYQQAGAPRKGKLFQREMFQYVPSYPDNQQLLRVWDLAFTEDESNCPACGALGCMTPERDMYIMDMRMAHKEWPGLKAMIIDAYRTDPPGTIHYMEANGPQLGYVQEVNNKLKELGLVTGGRKPVRGIKTVPDKMTLSRLWQSIQNEGKVYFAHKCFTEPGNIPRPAWINDAVDCCAEYPKVRYNEPVNAIGLINMMAGRRPKQARAI